MNLTLAARHTWFFAFHVMLCLLILVTMIGCSNDGETDESKSTAQLEAGETTTAVLPNGSESQTSPAAALTELPKSDAKPDVVCQRFMELLQSGNRSTAEKLLTRTAYTVTSQADFQIPPVGSAAATFEIQAVRYATNKQKLAQTDCTVVEMVEGKSQESEITWMVRRKPEGWRIFGMLVQLYDDKPKDLISFENPSDVAMIKETLADQQLGQNEDPSDGSDGSDGSETARSANNDPISVSQSSQNSNRDG